MPPEISIAALPEVPMGIPPRPRQLLSVDVGRRLPDFYHYQHIRMLYVYFQMRIALQNPTAQLPADFR